LFGAAELIGHDEIKIPSDAMNEKLLVVYSEDYMYLSK